MTTDMNTASDPERTGPEMPYTAARPAPERTSEELRAAIPGWGVDRDRQDRPSVPREQLDPTLSGAHWDFPERQPEKWPRERSIEHRFLTPVFGTACPPKGLSGGMRRYAYTLSEARAGHWLMLMAADRVDVAECRVTALMRLRPDNPVTETGVLTEFSHHGVASRFGKNRADVGHHALDPLIVAGPAVAGLAYLARKAVTRSRERRA